LFGAQKFDGGEIILNNIRIKINSTKKAIQRGIVLVPEDRQLQGLILGLTTQRNISLSNLKPYMSGIRVSSKKEEKKVRELCNAVGLRHVTMQQQTGELSGGNQQKAVFAKWLNVDYQILILDDPARGIDVGAKAQIFHMIGELADSGKSIILISSEMGEILGMCDRILVLHDGRICGELDRSVATEERVIQLIDEADENKE
jgi:ribose transport system ATP-binding protein